MAADQQQNRIIASREALSWKGHDRPARCNLRKTSKQEELEPTRALLPKSGKNRRLERCPAWDNGPTCSSTIGKHGSLATDREIRAKEKRHLVDRKNKQKNQSLSKTWELKN
jgi:hypothetical protein